MVRAAYLRRLRMLPAVFGQERGTIEDNFVTLKIAPHSESQLAEEKLRESEGEFSSYDKLYSETSNVDVNKFFVNGPRRVLITGRAGVGKSTLSQYATYEWAIGRVWS